ncbi:uncharacterized protein [Haliotis asinina]|uniref:uncharacterized protein n=1 Tax=Haliotis asinina TaxID=109174 RepID=UPI003531A5C5
MAGLQRVEYVKSQKGAPQVFLQGHTYTKNKVRGEFVHWRCTVSNCKGKCTTAGDFSVNVYGEHLHPPRDSNAVRIISTLRKRAREETTPVQAIYNDEIARLTPDAAPTMPSFASVSSALYRHRQTSIPALTQSRRDVDLQGQWTEIQDGRPFLLFSDGDDDKMIAFSTEEQLATLQSADTIYMDGTFSSCPLWSQLYIIHARSGSTMYPLVFVLMPDRQQTTYARLFRLLKDKVQEVHNSPLQPTRVQKLKSKGVFSITAKQYGGKHKILALLFSTKTTLTYRDGSAELLASHSCRSVMFRTHGLMP